MSRTHVALAVAIAVSFGVIRPTLSPIGEVPLSKSDILIVDNSSGQGSAKMGSGTASNNSNGPSLNEASKSDKMTGSATK